MEDAYGSNQSSVANEKINQSLAEGKGSNETIETIILRVESKVSELERVWNEVKKRRGPLLVDEHIEEPDRTPHGVEAALNNEECGSLQSEASMGVSEEAMEDAYGSNQSSVANEKINQSLAEGKGSNKTIETIIVRVESKVNELERVWNEVKKRSYKT